MGLPRQWIGYVFLLATVGLYAGIGVMSRTSDAAEYYVAGRRVPALFNGMATGADWMSAASFIGMAGTLYLTGFGGLAFVMGWTGGYCLVALFLAPYLRKFGQFTIPDFLGARYGGHIPRDGRHLRRDPVLVHLRGGADLRRRPDHDAPDRRRVRGRHLPRPRRHSGLLVPGRHARGDVDAGRAVHHPDRRLHDPGGLAVGEADRHPDAADRLRQAAREGHGARGEVHQGPEGARGPRHLQGARRRGEREAEGPAGSFEPASEARRRRREAEGRQRAGRAGRRRREGARRVSEGRGRRQGRSGRRTPASPRAPARRCGMPRRSRARTTPRATCRAATSSRWSSA